MTALVVAASIGAAFSGAVLYSYYEYRLNQTQERVEALAGTFDEQIDEAKKILDQEREDARAQIRQELEPLQKVAAEGETLGKVLEKVQPSVWFVETQDEAGQPSVGTGFVVASDSEESYLLTSFTTVRAASRQPGPAIVVRKGDDRFEGVDLWTWQEERDLALLIIPRGNQPKLSFAEGDPKTKTGERLFAVSGLGATGASISQGFVSDVSGPAIQHDVAVGAHYQGSPMVNSNSEVVAIASRAYAPLGFSSEGVFFGVPVQLACEKVLRCPKGSSAQPGPSR
jgi:S1-C subfamily serine protease